MARDFQPKADDFMDKHFNKFMLATIIAALVVIILVGVVAVHFIAKVW